LTSPAEFDSVSWTFERETLGAVVVFIGDMKP
jgi:hypothetical protein